MEHKFTEQFKELEDTILKQSAIFLDQPDLSDEQSEKFNSFVGEVVSSFKKVITLYDTEMQDMSYIADNLKPIIDSFDIGKGKKSAIKKALNIEE